MMNKLKKQVSLQAVYIIVLGSIVWSLTMIKSGLVYSYGIGFWGPNGHDGIWHLALIKSLARGSWQTPIFAGEMLKNYHLGFDLIVAAIHKLTLIPVSVLYFQVLPPVVALLIGYFAYKFIYTFTKSQNKTLWSLFFIYFGGSWGWVITLIRSSQLGGESLFWSQQSISTLVNPPFALSLVFMFAGLYFLQTGISRKNKRYLLLATFLFGLLIQVKVYAGLLSLGGLFLAGIWQMSKRKGIAVFKVFTGALIISILLFNTLNEVATGSIVLKPFWFLETMMQVSDRLYWPRFAQAMVNYKLAGNLIKAPVSYLVAFVIFTLGNMGTRMVKFPKVFDWLKNLKKLNFVDVFFLSVITAGIIIPLFFVQKGTPWNTIQFMYYSLMLSGVLAGIFVSDWIKKLNSKYKRWFVGTLVVLLTLPTSVGTLTQYLPQRPPAKLPKEEIEALKFLSKEPLGVVLTYPFDRTAAEEASGRPPRPLYLYESSAYVSAYSNKPVFLEDEVNLNITDYDWVQRRKDVESFLAENSQEKVRTFLAENDIAYVYWIKGQRALLGESQLGIEQIFENSKVFIYKVH